MPSLNFQSRFADDVEAGRKRQSIRAKCRFKVGDTAHLFTGMRTKQCRRLGKGIVTDVLPVTISRVETARYSKPVVTVDGRELALSAAHMLAMDDGFTRLGEMEQWFAQQHGLPFAGWLIKWDPVA